MSVLKPHEIPVRSVKEEYALAKKEGRQPLCPYCGQPLLISQTQYVFLNWVWDDEEKKYIKQDDNDGDADKPFCESCDTRDWDFVDEEVYKFF